MSGKKKSRLKSRAFSFKDQGQLSHGKDLDVQYVTHKKITKKNRKSTWVESCADPQYDTGPLPASSPHKRVKHHHEGPDSLPGDFEREVYKDFMLYTDTENPRRQTKAGSSSQIQKITVTESF
jgi:hypothetical protein